MKTGEQQETGAAAPEVCVTASVQPEDAAYIGWVAKREQRDPWIVAGVLAELGMFSLRDDRAARKIGLDASHCLWMCINREREDFSESMPVCVDVTEGAWFEITEDSRQMDRDVGDWLGSLIRIGVKMHRAEKGLEFAVHYREFSLLLTHCESELKKQIEEEATCS